MEPAYTRSLYLVVNYVLPERDVEARALDLRVNAIEPDKAESGDSPSADQAKADEPLAHVRAGSGEMC